MRLTLLTPGDLTEPSGGNVYNAALGRAWEGLPEPSRLPLTMRPVPGRWPTPTSADLDALTEVLATDRGPILIDGLIGSVAADPIEAVADQGRPVWLLVHLPLPAESGLAAAQRDRLEQLEARAVHAATGVICTSAWAARDLVRRYGPLRVWVAEPGTEPAPLAAGSRPPLLLTVAALTPRKNHLVLLRALESLADLEWSARWVGPPDRAVARAGALSGAVARSTVGPRVTLTGALHGFDLEREWAQADLLVLPSLAETYAMVVTEALARGVPAVVGAGTGAESTLCGPASQPGPGRPRSAESAAAADDSVPGAALDPTSPVELAHVLRRWLTDETLRATWARAARLRRRHQRSWACTAHEMREIVGGTAP